MEKGERGMDEECMKRCLHMVKQWKKWVGGYAVQREWVWHASEVEIRNGICKGRQWKNERDGYWKKMNLTDMGDNVESKTNMKMCMGMGDCIMSLMEYEG